MYSLSRRKLIKGIFPLSIYLSANRSDAVGLKNYPQYFNSDQFDKTKEELSALSYISKDKVAFLDVGLEPIPKGIVINKQRSFLGAKNGG